MSHTYLESHGVRLDVEVQAEALMPAVERILPPGWERTEEFPEDGHFTLGGHAEGGHHVLAEGSRIGSNLTADVAIHVLDAQIRARIALLAPERFFIHAGVAAVGDRAVIIPAPSFSGKSTLVAALVAAGATYFSDEHGVLDAHGMVHPFARPLSLRGESDRYGTYNDVESLGGTAGIEPARVALIVLTKYVPGATFAPEERNPGVGALGLLTNAVPARTRSEATVPAVGRAAAHAKVLEGDRGEAEEAAAAIVALLHSTP